MRIGWQLGHPPEGDEDYYLVQLDYGGMCICKWDDLNYLGKHGSTWHWTKPAYTEVVAWMPLPLPYVPTYCDE